MRELRIFWADTRGKTTLVLCLLWMASAIHYARPNLFWFPLVALATSVVLDILLGRLRWGTWFFSPSSVVTGLLIGLILDPTGSVWMVLSACAVASLSKLFLGAGKKKHIANPAALGIVIASVIFHHPVAWWAPSWGTIPLVIIVVGMTPVLVRLRRLWMPITFLIVYFVTNLLFTALPGAIRLTLDSTVTLFAFVMIPEPITAVPIGRWRYLWGGLVGVFVLALSLLSFALTDPLLTALLAANIVGFIVRRRGYTRIT